MEIRKFWRLFADMSQPVAWPIDDDARRANRHVYNRTKRPTGHIDGWVPLDFELRGQARFLDNIASVTQFGLYSEQLRAVIEGVLGDRDLVQWLPVTVRSVDGSEVRDYWVLHPLVDPRELIDQDASVYGEGRVDVDGPVMIKAVLAYDKVEGRNIAKYPYGPNPIVSDRIRQAVEAAGCTGVVFEPVPVR